MVHTGSVDDGDLEAAGLFDPAVDGPARAAFVRRCLDIGMTPDEIRAAGDDLLEVAIQRVYAPGDTPLTLAEVTRRAGIPASHVEQIVRAAGPTMPNLSEPAFNEDDVTLIALLGQALDLLGPDAILKVLRVSGSAVARIGDAAMSVFLTDAAAPAIRDDESGLQLLEANIAAAQLLPQFGDMLTHMLVRYIQRSYRQVSDHDVDRALDWGVDARSLAIGFADLVGSTTLADSRSMADLNAALDVFETTAVETVTKAGGRVVKFIGDEVMFRGDTADVACRAALDLVEAVRADPGLPPLRAGIAVGDVLVREGDFYGPIVNLAARVTKLAPLHGVVVTADTAAAIVDHDVIAVNALGAIEVHGFSEPVDLASIVSVSGGVQ